jgi:hypothetical protein
MEGFNSGVKGLKTHEFCKMIPTCYTSWTLYVKLHWNCSEWDIMGLLSINAVTTEKGILSGII